MPPKLRIRLGLIPIAFLLATAAAPPAQALALAAHGCGLPSTDSASGPFEWYVAGARDPGDPRTYFWASWTWTTHYGGPECKPVASYCDVLVADGLGRAVNGDAHIRWTKSANPETTVHGAYHGVAFYGTDGVCGGDGVQFAGRLAGLVPIEGYGGWWAW